MTNKQDKRNIKYTKYHSQFPSQHALHCPVGSARHTLSSHHVHLILVRIGPCLVLSYPLFPCSVSGCCWSSRSFLFSVSITVHSEGCCVVEWAVCGWESCSLTITGSRLARDQPQLLLDILFSAPELCYSPCCFSISYCLGGFALVIPSWL